MKAIAKIFLVLLYGVLSMTMLRAQCPSDVIVDVSQHNLTTTLDNLSGQTFTVPAGNSRRLSGLTVFSGETSSTTTFTPTLTIYEGEGYSGEVLYMEEYSLTWPFENDPEVFFAIQDGPYLSAGSAYTFRLQDAGNVQFSSSNTYSGGAFYYDDGLVPTQEYKFRIHASSETGTTVPTISGDTDFTCGAITLSTSAVADSYQWYEDGTLLAGQVSGSLVVDLFLADEEATKSYQVEAIFSNGCGAISTQHIINGYNKPTCGNSVSVQQLQNSDSGAGVSFGQSFTMPTSSDSYLLESIEILSGGNQSSVNATFSIYEGEGFGGKLLYSQNFSFFWPADGNFISFPPTDGVLLSGGEKYTYRIVGGGHYRLFGQNVYPGGIRFAGTVEPSHDMVFRINTFDTGSLIKPAISVVTNGDGSKTLSASDVGACSYEWFRNNVAIPNQTTRNYDIPTGETGNYWVVANSADGCGSISDLVDLTPPAFTSAGAISIEENIVGVVYTAIADDFSGVTYFLDSENDEALFQIDAMTGEVTFLSSPDFETPQDADANNEYVIDIIATDANGVSANHEVRITVNDLDENDPVITSFMAYDFVDGSDEVVFVATATDESPISFMLGSGLDNSLFTIDGSSGEARFVSPPQFLVPSDQDGDNVYEIELVVTDDFMNTSAQFVNISVLQIEMDAPMFTSSAVSTTPEGTINVVYTISAIDNTQVNYSLGSSKDESFFTVNEFSGEVAFAIPVSFENPLDQYVDAHDNDYVIDVIATDIFDNTATQEVVVTVTNDPTDDCSIALNFDGDGDKVELTDALTIGNTSHTLEMWIKIPEAGSGGLTGIERVGVILGNFNSNSPSGANTNWEVHDDGQVRVFWNNGQINQFGSTDLRDNQWHHIAFIRNKDDNTYKVYIDGAEEINNTSAGSDVAFNENTLFSIGSDARSSSPNFHGSMDDMRIWDVALTPEQLLESIAGTIDLTSSNLLSNYDFEEGLGTTLTDVKGDNNGMIDGSTWQRRDGSDASIPIAQVISFGTLDSKSSLDPPFELSASGGLSGNPIVYASSDETVATISGSTVTIVGGGTATITASQSGIECYADAVSVQQDLTVIKEDQSIVFDALTARTFGDPNFDLVATGGASGNPVTFTSSDETVATIAGNTVTIVGAGSSTITASQEGNNTYENAIAVDQTLTVNKADQTITFEPLPAKTYGDPAFDLVATASSGLEVQYSAPKLPNVYSISGSMVTILSAGSEQVRANQSGNENYNIAPSISQSLTVNKASLVITADDQAITFGDALPLFTRSYAGFVNGDDESVLDSPPTAFASADGNGESDAGTYIINLSGGSDNSYDLTLNDGTLTINKADQTITFDALNEKTFGDAPFDLSATGGASGNAVTFVSSDETVATISGSTVTIVGAGSTIITASQTGSVNYNNAVDVAHTLIVNQAAQTISFETIAPRTFGDGSFDLTATSSSGLPITYTSSDETVATISGSTVTIVGVGSALITANQAGDDDYEAAADVHQTLTIDKADQTITFDALAARTFGDGSFDLIATGGASGNAVTFSSSDEAVATVSGSTVTIVGAGSAVITASQVGDNNYESASDVQQTLAVNQAAQAITFNAIEKKTFGDAAFDLNATGGASGNAVTYVSSDETVATVSGNTVTIVGAGSTTITANQTGNANYENASDVQQTLIVNQAAQAITFNAIETKTFGDAAFDLSATGGGSGNAVTYTSSDETVATISGNTVTIVGAGSTTITANQAGNANYEAASDVQQTLTVNQAAQSITFNAIETKTFGDAAFDLNATGGASGNAVTYTSSEETVATVAGNTVTIVGAGSTTITASQAGNVNYETASDVQQEFSVGKADQAITFAAIADVDLLANNMVELNASSDAGLTVIFSIVQGDGTLSGSTLTVNSTGNFIVEASQSGNSNYNAATSVTQSFTVTDSRKGDQSITFNALDSKTYGDASFELSATASSGLSISYASSDETVATILGSIVTVVGAGTATITATQGGNADFNPAVAVAQVLTVDKASLTATANDQTIIFGDALPTLTLSYTGFVNGDAEGVIDTEPTIATTADGNGASDAGVYPITLSGGGDNNYELNLIDGTLTIGKAEQVISFDAIADVDLASTNEVTLAATSNAGLDVAFALIEGSGTIANDILTVTSTGNFVVEASQAGNLNYNAASEVQSFTVTDSRKADQTIDFPEISNKTYGDVFTLDATATSNLAVSYVLVSGPANLMDAEVTVSGVGEVVIEASQNGDTNFNPATTETRSFTAGKATLTVIAEDKERTFNMENPALTISYGGFIGGDVEADLDELPAASTAADVASDAGSYAIVVDGGLDNNYDFQYTNGTLTVTKAAASIMLSDLEQESDGTAKEPTVTTDPTGLNFTIEWDAGAAPVTAGDFDFTVAIEETNYAGEESGVLSVIQVLGLLDTSVRIYPNPVSNFLVIDSDEPLEVEITTLERKVVLQTKSDKEIDLSALSDAVHLLKLTNDRGESKTTTFIKRSN